MAARQWVVIGEGLRLTLHIPQTPMAYPQSVMDHRGPIGTGVSSVDTPTETTARVIPDVPGLWTMTLEIDNGILTESCLTSSRQPADGWSPMMQQPFKRPSTWHPMAMLSQSDPDIQGVTRPEWCRRIHRGSRSSKRCRY